MRFDYVRQWLEGADNDIEAGEAIVERVMRSYETASFHAQQGAEKALKALLIRHQVEFPKSHDLGELLRLAEPIAVGISQELGDAERLNRHAVDTRYPTSGPPVDRDQARRDLTLGARVRDYVRDLLQPYLDAGPRGS